MAIAEPDAQLDNQPDNRSNIQLKKIINPGDIDIEYFEIFIKSLVLLLNKQGLPYHLGKLQVPEKKGFKELTFWQGPRDSTLPMEQRKNSDQYIFYADLVNVVGQAVEYYFDSGNDRAKEILKHTLPYVRDEKILQNLVGIDHVLDDHIVQINWISKVLPIINRLFIAASVTSEKGIEGIDNSEYLLEQKEKSEEAAREEEKRLAALIANAGSAGGGVSSKVATPGAEGAVADSHIDSATPTDSTNIQPGQDQAPPVHGLRISDLKAIETEVAWISSPLVYSLFGSLGISQEFINQHPDLRQDLYEHVRQTYLKSGVKSRSSVYSGARATLPYEFLTKLENFYIEYSKTLPPEKQSVFLDSVKKTQGLLKSYVPLPTFEQDIANIFKDDSRLLSENIKNAIDALVISNGVALQVVTENSSGVSQLKNITGQEKDALYIIKILPDDYLKLIFGIPSNINLTKEQVEKLRAIAIGYAQKRALELALITKSETVARGTYETNTLALEDLSSTKNAIPTRRTVATVLPGFFSRKDDVKEKGAEVVSRAINNNARDQAVRQLLFWNQLDDEHKNIILENIGLNPTKYTDLATPPERLRLFNIVEETLKADAILAEFHANLKSMIIEENLRRKYLYELQLALGNEAWKAVEEFYIAQQEALMLADQYDEMSVSFNDLAPQEVMDLHDELPGFRNSDGFYISDEPEVLEDFEEQVEHRAGSSSRRPSRRLKNKSKKKARAAKKLAKNAGKEGKKKLLENRLAQIAAMGGPWGKVAAFTLKHRKAAAAIVGVAGGLIIGGLIKMFTAGKAALISGAVGGVVGGVAGFFIGGPIGAVIGATLGASAGGYLGASSAMSGSSFPGLSGIKDFFNSGTSSSTAGQITSGATQVVPAGSSSAITSATTAEAATTAAPALTSANIAASAVQMLSTLSIGVLAPMGMLVAMIVFSLYVLFVIFASFLIPLPIGYDFDDLPDLPPGLNACWPTTGVLTQLAQSGHSGSDDSNVGGVHQAIDIACNPASCPPGGGEWPPKVYASHNGTVSIFQPPADGYGLMVKITSPEGYSTIYAHLSNIAPGLKTGDTVGRGQFIAYMGSTGNSTGPHLHYELLNGGLISSIVPPGEYDDNIFVTENCSTGGVPNPNSEGYLAIGPLTSNNVVASTKNDIENTSPTATCSWQGTKGLEVAVNANFFNTNDDGSIVPVGYAGEGGQVKYYEDSTSPGFEAQMSTLIDNDGNFTTVRGKTPDPSSWDMAITGLYASGSSSDTSVRQRTIIGIGTANDKCTTEYVGQRVLFLGVMPNATFDQIEAALRECGATTVIHMDGGGSTAFCSNTFTHPTTRNVPVNIGMREAEVIEFPGSGLNPTDPLPP